MRLRVQSCLLTEKTTEVVINQVMARYEVSREDAMVAITLGKIRKGDIKGEMTIQGLTNRENPREYLSGRYFVVIPQGTTDEFTLVADENGVVYTSEIE